MSGFKFSHLVVIVLGIIALICLVTSIQYFIKAKKEKSDIREINERPFYRITLYTAEGDTIDLKTEFDQVKIWIEEDGKVDVWANTGEGWIRK